MKVIDKSKGTTKNIDLMAVAKQQSDSRLRRMKEAGKSTASSEAQESGNIKKGKGFEDGFSSAEGNTGAGTPRGARSSLGTGLDPKLGSGSIVPTGGH